MNNIRAYWVEMCFDILSTYVGRLLLDFSRETNYEVAGINTKW